MQIWVGSLVAHYLNQEQASEDRYFLSTGQGTGKRKATDLKRVFSVCFYLVGNHGVFTKIRYNPRTTM